MTVTFSRALHLMRYSQAKMRSVLWTDGMYIKILNGAITLFHQDTMIGVIDLQSQEIMGSWEVV